MAHPTRGHPIWVPMGIGGKIVPDRNGVRFKGNGVEIKYLYLPNAGPEVVYNYMLSKISGEGQNISYRVMRNGFFAISSEKDGASEYLRYHQKARDYSGSQCFGETMMSRSMAGASWRSCLSFEPNAGNADDPGATVRRRPQ